MRWQWFVLCALSTFGIFTAQTAGEAKATFRRLVESALRRAGISLCAAALTMYPPDAERGRKGGDQAQLRRELDEGRLNGWRLSLLPAEFWRELLELAGEAHDAEVVPASEVGRWIALGQVAPRPARMELPDRAPKQREAV